MSKKKTDLEVFQEWVQELKDLVFGDDYPFNTEFGSGRTMKEMIKIDEKNKTQRDKGYTPEHTKQWLDSVKKPKRARTEKGRYRGDDKSTKEFNEAWVGGKAPKKRKK